VLVQRDTDKPNIKRYLDSIGVVSQFMLHKNISKKVGVMGVITNLLRQVNAKCPLDLYRVNVPQKLAATNTMIVGVFMQNIKKS